MFIIAVAVIFRSRALRRRKRMAALRQRVFPSMLSSSNQKAYCGALATLSTATGAHTEAPVVSMTSNGRVGSRATSAVDMGKLAGCK